MNAADERRLALLRWLRERASYKSWTARQSAVISGVYPDYWWYRYDRCFDDLAVLEHRGLVTRHPGQPATWTAVPEREET